MPDDLNRFQSSRLAALFAVGTGEEVRWTSGDLREILQHQFGMLLSKELCLEAWQLRALERAELGT
ncbi:MAG: hypothetical protein ABSF29_07675 [Tepidisphaeraceae bacterium]|jgi:hypothetical protein